jgi:hypothetical protein
MFPESFPAYWIERLTEPGDAVLDPFCGRGTTPLQALLMGRRAVASDVNPVAYCVTKAKTRPPQLGRVLRRIGQLEGAYDPEGHAGDAEALPPFFHVAYAPATLPQILHLRGSLRWRSSDVDAMVAALLLGRLHGESDRSPSYLSNQMPRTISPKPGYSLRYWRDRLLTAPERDVFGLLRLHASYRYASPRPALRGKCHNLDVRKLPPTRVGADRRIRCVVTSPPYYDVTRYEEDQWLRLWFLGGPPRPTYGLVSRDDRYEALGRYWSFLGDAWQALGAILAPRADVVVRIGGKGLSDDELVQGLLRSSVAAGRRVALAERTTGPIERKQTHSFRPGAAGCRTEVDCHFVVE